GGARGGRLGSGRRQGGAGARARPRRCPRAGHAARPASRAPEALRARGGVVSRGRIAFFLPSVRGGGAQRVIVDHIPPEVRVVDLGGRRLLGGFVPLVGYLRRERPRVLISSMSHANML